MYNKSNTVEIESTKEHKSMSHLKIGDQILVDIDKQGQRIYKPIYSFIHTSPYGIYDYFK